MSARTRGCDGKNKKFAINVDVRDQTFLDSKREAFRQYASSSRLYLAKFKGKYSKCKICGHSRWRPSIPWELPGYESAEGMCDLCNERIKLYYRRRRVYQKFDGCQEKNLQCISGKADDRGYSEVYDRRFTGICNDEFIQNPCLSSVVVDGIPSPPPFPENNECIIEDGGQNSVLDEPKFVRIPEASEEFESLSLGPSFDWEDFLSYDNN